VLGARLYMPDAQVVCAKVDTDPFEEIVPDITKQSAELLGLDIEIPDPAFADMCGPGYSIPSEEGNDAISMMMKNEGILLDTCYTGKAFAALIQAAREGRFSPSDNVLFIHTGGAGGLFAQDWEKEDKK